LNFPSDTFERQNVLLWGYPGSGYQTSVLRIIKYVEVRIEVCESRAAVSDFAF